MTLLILLTTLFLITIVWSYSNSALFLTFKSISTINYIGNVYRPFNEVKQILLLNINSRKNQSVAIYSVILTSEAPHVTQEYMIHFQEGLLHVKEIGHTVLNTLVENAGLLLNSYIISFLFLVTFGIKPIKSSILTCARLMPQLEKEMPWKKEDEDKFSYGGGFGFAVLKPQTWEDFSLFMRRAVTAVRGLSSSSNGSGPGTPNSSKPNPKTTKPFVPVDTVASSQPSAVSTPHASPVQSCATPASTTYNINVRVTPSAVVATTITVGAIAAWKIDPVATMTAVKELTEIFGNSAGQGLGTWGGNNPSKVAVIADALQNTPTGQETINKFATLAGQAAAAKGKDIVVDAIISPVVAVGDMIGSVVDKFSSAKPK